MQKESKERLRQIAKELMASDDLTVKQAGKTLNLLTTGIWKESQRAKREAAEALAHQAYVIQRLDEKEIEARVAAREAELQAELESELEEGAAEIKATFDKATAKMNAEKEEWEHARDRLVEWLDSKASVSYGDYEFRIMAFGDIGRDEDAMLAAIQAIWHMEVEKDFDHTTGKIAESRLRVHFQPDKKRKLLFIIVMTAEQFENAGVINNQLSAEYEGLLRRALRDNRGPKPK